MSSKPLMLEGLAPKEHSDDGLLQRLRKEKQQLEEEVLSVRRELDDANREKDHVERSIRNLRGQLGPLHRALRAIFGEIELGIGEETASVADVRPGTAPNSPSGADPRWESYKQNFPGAPSQIIDALLAHGQMKMTHLAKLIKRDYSTVKGAVKKLKDAGAVIGEGGPEGGIRLKL